MVEAHSATIHISRLNLHSVEVQALHQEPCKGAEEEVMQEDGDRSAQQLKGQETGVRVPPTHHILASTPHLFFPLTSLTTSSNPSQHPAPNLDLDFSIPEFRS